MTWKTNVKCCSRWSRKTTRTCKCQEPHAPGKQPGRRSYILILVRTLTVTYLVLLLCAGVISLRCGVLRRARGAAVNTTAVNYEKRKTG